MLISRSKLDLFLNYVYIKRQFATNQLLKNLEVLTSLQSGFKTFFMAFLEKPVDSATGKGTG
jgi:hypothetical protein